MYGAWAQASKALEVQRGPVALVQVEPVAGAEGIGVYHETVPGDFGSDGSGGDGVALAVTARHGGAGQVGFLQGEEVDEKVVGSCGQCLYGSDHCQLGGGDDTVGVYFRRASFTDAYG